MFTRLGLRLGTIGLLLGLGCLVYAADPTTDLLPGVKADVNTNFGLGSTFMWLVYFAEVILGAVAYVKTKNYWVLIPIVVLIIFTTVAFAMIG
jgi:type IV conjugative transfer system pilin TraA